MQIKIFTIFTLCLSTLIFSQNNSQEEAYLNSLDPLKGTHRGHWDTYDDGDLKNDIKPTQMEKLSVPDMSFEPIEEVKDIKSYYPESKKVKKKSEMEKFQEKHIDNYKPKSSNTLNDKNDPYQILEKKNQSNEIVDRSSYDNIYYSENEDIEETEDYQNDDEYYTTDSTSQNKNSNNVLFIIIILVPILVFIYLKYFKNFDIINHTVDSFKELYNLSPSTNHREKLIDTLRFRINAAKASGNPNKIEIKDTNQFINSIKEDMALLIFVMLMKESKAKRMQFSKEPEKYFLKIVNAVAQRFPNYDRRNVSENIEVAKLKAKYDSYFY